MYFNGKQFDQAITDWNEAIRLEPSIGTYYEHRGYALTALGRGGEAAEDFEKAGGLGGP